MTLADDQGLRYKGRGEAYSPDSLAEANAIVLRHPQMFHAAEVSRVASQRTYGSNGTTVTEFDTTDTDGQTYEDAEVLRYLNMMAERMGQSPLSTDTGNREGSQPAPSTFGQRTKEPWFSG